MENCLASLPCLPELDLGGQHSSPGDSGTKVISLSSIGLMVTVNVGITIRLLSTLAVRSSGGTDAAPEATGGSTCGCCIAGCGIVGMVMLNPPPPSSPPVSTSSLMANPGTALTPLRGDLSISLALEEARVSVLCNPPKLVGRLLG